MYTLSYTQILNHTPQEILKEKEIQKKELIEAINSEEFSDSFKDVLKADIKDIESNFNVVVDVNEIDIAKFDIDNINKLINISNVINMPMQLIVKGCEYKKQGLKECVDLLFKDETIDKFAEFNNYLANNHQRELIFMEADISSSERWELANIKKANDRVNKVVNTIKEYEFTPLETMAFLHKLISKSFTYQENEDKPSLARSLIGVLNTNNIVCVGYTNIVKAIIDKLEDDNLVSDGNTITLKCKENGSNDLSTILGNNTAHINNLIFIKDEKYNVEGVYICDITCDCRTEYILGGKGYTNFMLPVTDLMCFKDYTVIQYEDSMDQFLSGFGIDSEYKEELPVVSKYKDNSKPIPYETLSEVIKKALKVIYYIKDDDKLEERFRSEMKLSRIRSYYQFDDNATNAIRLETKKYTYE